MDLGLCTKQNGNALMQYVLAGVLILLVCISALSSLGVSIFSWFSKFGYQIELVNDGIQLNHNKPTLPNYPDKRNNSRFSGVMPPENIGSNKEKLIDDIKQISIKRPETSGGNGHKDYKSRLPSADPGGTVPPLPPTGDEPKDPQNQGEAHTTDCRGNFPHEGGC